MPQQNSRANITVIVFSKDRPLQLHAALSSLRATCLNAARLNVRAIVYASDDAMAARYGQVARELPWCELVPENNFKATLTACTADAMHVAFVVDDTLFVRPWSPDQIIDMLAKEPRAIGVSLRLGRNTSDCYSLGRPQVIPPLSPLSGPWLSCDWTQAADDFGYPLELSSSVYRAADVGPALTKLTYTNPNELELALSGLRPWFMKRHPLLILPSTSMAFSVPLNVVQESFANRHSGRIECSPQALGALFDNGQRVHIAALAGYTPRGCHEEIELPMIVPTSVAARIPAVSIVIPCFDQADFLDMAIDSVLAQTYTDWELIVVDDGSRDHSADLVHRIAAANETRAIRLLQQPNSGLANARNAGIKAAHGRLIVALDSDDAIAPTFLSRTVAALAAAPAASIAYTNVALFGSALGIWDTNHPFDLSHVVEANNTPYCALYRREVWERVGGYQANMSLGYEDWNFWVAAAAAGFRAVQIPEPLFMYRTKAHSMLTEARAHDESLRAQLVLNHERLFTEAMLADARRVLAQRPLPPAKPAAVSQEIALGRRVVGGGSPTAAAPAMPRAKSTREAAIASRTTPRPAVLPNAPADPDSTLDALRTAGVWSSPSPLRLHLGCGEQRLEGYLNIDLPPNDTTFMQSVADALADVATLRFPAGSVDEIRCHHMFEHFSRVEALELLVRWHEWLKPGGRLMIETPDLEGSARTLSSDHSYEVKMGVVRHLAGDQAAPWAFHVDHWFPERFQRTLGELGFVDVTVEQRSWPHPPYLSNVTAVARKDANRSRDVLIRAAERLLCESTVAPGEKPTLLRWCEQLRASLGGVPVPRARVSSTVGSLGVVQPAAAPAPVSWMHELIAQGTHGPIAEVHDFNQRHRDAWVAERAAEVPAGARVLDVGAGTCPYRALFAHCDYTTHDFKRYDGIKLGGTASYGGIDVVSDIDAIPASDASFDVVLCTEVLEHVPDPIGAVREMTRLLRPGGRLLITAPLGSGLHQLPFHYYGGFSPEWYRHHGRALGLDVRTITPNGGFFKLLAQETARAAEMLRAAPRPQSAEVLQLLGDWLPRWFNALDPSLGGEQFTVGYFVDAVRTAPTKLQRQTQCFSSVA